MPGTIDYIMVAGTEYMRVYTDGFSAVDFLVTPAIQATQHYIDNHVAQEAVPVATDDATNLTGDPSDPLVQGLI